MDNKLTIPKLITVREAAKYLSISERKLWQLSKYEKLPTVRFDRVVRYDINDLDDFIRHAKGVK